MPRMTLSKFVAAHGQAHLVVLTLPDVSNEGPSAREVFDTMARFIRQRIPAASFGSAIIRETGKEEVRFAFSRESDARWLSDELQAKLTGHDDGWASKAIAVVTASKFTDVSATLLPPQRSSSSHRHAIDLDES